MKILLALTTVLAASCASAVAAPGCPASYTGQSVSVSARIASQTILGFERYTSLEDASKTVCVVRSKRAVGTEGTSIQLDGMIATRITGIGANFLMYKDEYEAEAISNP